MELRLRARVRRCAVRRIVSLWPVLVGPGELTFDRRESRLEVTDKRVRGMRLVAKHTHTHSALLHLT